jgi:uncharacterized FlgJ-related protein
MKSVTNRIVIFTILLITGYASAAQTIASNTSATISKTTSMKTYLIERDIPGAGKLTPEQLKSISQKSCSVLKDMGPQIEWIQSYVTGDKIFCVYKAENEELIREHAKKGGFPANKITEVSTQISPATAEAN